MHKDKKLIWVGSSMCWVCAMVSFVRRILLTQCDQRLFGLGLGLSLDTFGLTEGLGVFVWLKAWFEFFGLTQILALVCFVWLLDCIGTSVRPQVFRGLSFSSCPKFGLGTRT